MSSWWWRRSLRGITCSNETNFMAVTPWRTKCKVLRKQRINHFIIEAFAHPVVLNPLQTLFSFSLCFSWNSIITIMGDIFSCVCIRLSATPLLLQSILFLLVGILLGSLGLPLGPLHLEILIHLLYPKYYLLHQPCSLDEQNLQLTTYNCEKE